MVGLNEGEEEEEAVAEFAAGKDAVEETGIEDIALEDKDPDDLTLGERMQVRRTKRSEQCGQGLQARHKRPARNQRPAKS